MLQRRTYEFRCGWQGEALTHVVVVMVAAVAVAAMVVEAGLEVEVGMTTC
jgi:hypothetical protein